MVNFSCLISGYHKDNPNHLVASLESLAQQTLSASEIVFVEDGNLNDDLYTILNKYEKVLPLKRIKLNTNCGLGNALNIGLNACSYELVVRMDTDDICFPTRFEKQIGFLMQNPEVDIVGSWCIEIDETGYEMKTRKYPTNHEELIKLIWTCPINHPTVAFRRSRIISIGSYNTSIKRRQDYELWFRAAIRRLKFHNIPENLLYYRTSANYYKKNNFEVSWLQVKIGWRGLFKLKVVNPVPYVGVAYPLIRLIVPNRLKSYVERKVQKMDPRNN